MYEILRNSAKCDNCGTILFSARSQAPVLCACGNFMIDGGRQYLGRSVRHFSYTEMSTYADMACNDCLGSGRAAMDTSCSCVRTAKALWGRDRSPSPASKPRGPVNAFDNGYRSDNARPRNPSPGYRTT